MNIIVATANRRDLVRRLLESLAKATIPAELDRIWVIENGSSDGTENVCREFEDRLPLHYRHESKPGKCAAYNAALREIETGLVVFLDDDVLVAPTLLEDYAQSMRTHGERAVYGGPIDVDIEVPPPSYILFDLPRSAKGWEPEDPENFSEWFLGPNWGAYAEQFIACGGFDENSGPGTSCPVGDEMVVQQRLFESGCAKVYVPGARVIHYVPECRNNVRFALRRLQVQSFASTVDQKPELNGKQIGGMPPWLLKRLIACWIKRAMSGFVPSAEMRYQLKRPWYRWTGYLQALRFLRSSQ